MSFYLLASHPYTSLWLAGVAENRLQNIVITLDKVKRFLRQPGQPLGPPLQLLSDEEVSYGVRSAQADSSLAGAVPKVALCQSSMDLPPLGSTATTAGGSAPLVW